MLVVGSDQHKLLRSILFIAIKSSLNWKMSGNRSEKTLSHYSDQSNTGTQLIKTNQSEQMKTKSWNKAKKKKTCMPTVYDLACEQQTHFWSSLLSLRKTNASAVRRLFTTRLPPIGSETG